MLGALAENTGDWFNLSLKPALRWNETYQLWPIPINSETGLKIWQESECEPYGA